MRLATLAIVGVAFLASAEASAQAELGTVPIRRVDVVGRPVLGEGTTRADYARAAALLQRKLAGRLGARLIPRARGGGRLTVEVSAFTIPSGEGLALGLGGGQLQGVARLSGARGEALADIPLDVSVGPRLSKPPTSVTGLMVGTAKRLATAAIVRRDGPEELAERAASRIGGALSGR